MDMSFSLAVVIMGGAGAVVIGVYILRKLSLSKLRGHFHLTGTSPLRSELIHNEEQEKKDLSASIQNYIESILTQQEQYNEIVRNMRAQTEKLPGIAIGSNQDPDIEELRQLRGAFSAELAVFEELSPDIEVGDFRLIDIEELKRIYCNLTSIGQALAKKLEMVLNIRKASHESLLQAHH